MCDCSTPMHMVYISYYNYGANELYEEYVLKQIVELYLEKDVTLIDVKNNEDRYLSDLDQALIPLMLDWQKKVVDIIETKIKTSS